MLKAKALIEGPEGKSTRQASSVDPQRLAKQASRTKTSAPASLSDLANDFSGQRVVASTVLARCRHHRKKRTPTHSRFPTTVATIHYSCYGLTCVH